MKNKKKGSFIYQGHVWLDEVNAYFPCFFGITYMKAKKKLIF